MRHIDQRFLKYSVDVWEYNPSSECTFDNSRLSCKTKYLYLLVYMDDQFEPATGMELGPSYGWNLLKIDYRQGLVDCILFGVSERVAIKTKNGVEMRIAPREVCISVGKFKR